MSKAGYFMNNSDLERWLDTAQSSPLTKNKVRKDLWSHFTECIHYHVSHRDFRSYTRIPRGHFISLQSFCLLDGKGSDNISNDQLLNIITTLDDLRRLLPYWVESDEEEQGGGISTSSTPSNQERKEVIPPTLKKKRALSL